MEPRLILAYSMIALLVAFAAFAIYSISKRRRKAHMINTGRGNHNRRKTGH